MSERKKRHELSYSDRRYIWEHRHEPCRQVAAVIGCSYGAVSLCLKRMRNGSGLTTPTIGFKSYGGGWN